MIAAPLPPPPPDTDRPSPSDNDCPYVIHLGLSNAAEYLADAALVLKQSIHLQSKRNHKDPDISK
jgi:hypothetical protein